MKDNVGELKMEVKKTNKAAQLKYLNESLNYINERLIDNEDRDKYLDKLIEFKKESIKELKRQKKINLDSLNSQMGFRKTVLDLIKKVKEK